MIEFVLLTQPALEAGLGDTVEAVTRWETVQGRAGQSFFHHHKEEADWGGGALPCPKRHWQGG